MNGAVGQDTSTARSDRLLELVRMATEPLGLSELLERVAVVAAELLPDSTATIWVAEGDRLVRRADVGSRPAPGRTAEFRLGEGLTGHAALETGPLVVEDLQADPRLVNRAWAAGQGYVSFVGIPLRVRERVLGVLGLATRHRHAFTEDELGLLCAFGAQAAIAIEHARLYRRLEERFERSQTLTRLNRLLSSSLDPETVLGEIVRAAVELTGACLGQFWEADERSRTIGVRSVACPGLDGTLPVAQLDYGEGLVGWVAAHRQALAVPDVPADGRAARPDWWRDRGLRSFLGVPIVQDGALIGVLALDGREPFDLEKTDALDSFAAQAAVAIRNARLHEASQRRRQRTEALHDLGRALVQSLDREEIARRVVERVQALLGVRSAACFESDEEGWLLTGLATSGVATDVLGPRPVLPIAGSFAGLAVRTRCAAATVDLCSDPRLDLPADVRAALEALSIRAGLAVPLLADERVIGVLAVMDSAGRVFGEEDVEFAQALADQAALALENARLHGRARARAQEARALADITAAVNSTLDLRRVLRVLGWRAVGALGAERAAVNLLEGGRLRPVMWQQADGRSARRMWVRMVRTPETLTWPIPALEEALRRREAVVVRDTAGSPLVPPDWVEALGVRSMLVVPLVLEGEPIGTLTFDHTRPYTWRPEQIRFATTIADQAAIAVKHARLYQEAEQGRRHAEELAASLETRNRQRAAVADLRRRAIEEVGTEELMRECAGLVQSVLGTERCQVFELRQEDQTLLMRATAGPPRGQAAGPVMAADAFSVPGRAALTGEPARAMVGRGGDDAESQVAVPIKGDVAKYGVLAASHHGARRFTEDEIRFLEAMADVLAAALARRRVEAARRREASFVGLLQSAATAANEAPSVEQVMEFVVRRVCRHMGWPIGHAYMPRGDGATEFASTDLWHFEDPDRFESFRRASDEIRFVPNRGLVGRVLATRQAAWLSSAVETPGFLRAEAAAAVGIVSGFAFPILVGSEVAAVLEFFATRRVESDPKLLEVMAHLGTLLGRVVERRRAEVALRASEERHRSLIQHAAYGIYRVTVDGRFVDVNPALVSMLGYDSPEELLRVNMAEGVYRDPAVRARRLAEVLEHRGLHRAEIEWRKRDGTPVTVRVTARLRRDPDGMVQDIEGIVEDVTERRALEAQFRQAQKMEAVGRLAGGIAHDFNNLLTVIHGHASLLLERLGEGTRERRRAEQIEATASRAAALTRQLLAFSRKQILQPQVVDLNALIADLSPLLRRVISEDIELTIVRGAGTELVRADRGQLDQVMLNLVVNARDAMPTGGRLIVETACVELGAEFTRHRPGARPGPHVLLRVRDSGVGMDEEVRLRVFEPFFTTKEIGKGTGLGLATVYGVVKQHEGYIEVESEVGKGTTFTIYLPRAFEPADGAHGPEPAAGPPRRTGTILLVEDEEEVRALAAEVLRARGYLVLEAARPSQALDMAQASPDRIDCVLSDVVMPQMSGPDLVKHLAVLHPEAAVLYMSGYTDDALGGRGVLEPGVALLAKPFTPDMLLQKVHEALEQVRPRSAGQ